MTSLNDLNPLFSGAYSIRFKPILNSIHIDIPELDKNNFGKINTILNAAAGAAPIILSLCFETEKKVRLTIKCRTEGITIDKLRPMYGLKEKLIRSNPATVELCLFNDVYPGLYIGTKFKLELEE